MLTVGLIVAGILGSAIALVAAKPRPSLCPGCGCLTLEPNRAGTLWFCTNCNDHYRFIGGAFLGPPRAGRALPPVTTIVKR